MKTVLKNSLLVSIVAGLLILPVFGFGFFDYTRDEINYQPTILGVQSRVKVIDQFSLKLSLSTEGIQKFYNVVPEEYLFPEFTSYVIGPKDLVDAGYLFEISDNGLSKDLVVTVPMSNSISREGEMIVDVPILIMRATPF